MIAIQVLSNNGRILTTLKLPASIRLADLEQLAARAGRPEALPGYLEQQLTAEVRKRARQMMEVQP